MILADIAMTEKFAFVVYPTFTTVDPCLTYSEKIKFKLNTFLWYKKTIVILCLMMIGRGIYSQSVEPAPKQRKEHKAKILPMAYYMPETRIGVGVLAYSVFRIKKSDTTSRNSNIQSYSSYTQNKQFSIENEWQIFSKKEKYIFSGALDYTRFPEYFYGIGNFTNASSKELYSFDLIRFRSKNVKHLGNKLFTGLQYDMQYLFNVKKKDAMMMNTNEVPGSNGYFSSGIGALLMYDTRNNVLNATSGSYAEILFSMNDKLTLSHFNYTTLIVDLRKYITFFDRYTLAFHGYGNFNSGVVPFRAMPVIGGARYLRGYYKGRYRDNNLIVFQGETRIRLFWRIGITAFAGIGQVADKAQHFDSNTFKYNYGAGIRYKLNKKENINLRLDMGFTKEGYGLYIVFAEAF